MYLKDAEIWALAQKLLPHVKKCGEKLYVFKSFRFDFEKDENVTINMIKKHLDAIDPYLKQNFWPLR